MTLGLMHFLMLGAFLFACGIACAQSPRRRACHCGSHRASASARSFAAARRAAVGFADSTIALRASPASTSVSDGPVAAPSRRSAGSGRFGASGSVRSARFTGAPSGV